MLIATTTTEWTLVLANTAAGLVMTGVIWFVQLVHYPLLALIGPERSTSIAVEHQRRTSWVVGAPMAVEGLTTLGLLARRPDAVWVGWPWIGGVLVAIALGSTVVLSVPLHARMARGEHAGIGRRLVVTNWPRTLAWTLHGAVGVVMTAQVLSA